MGKAKKKLAKKKEKKQIQSGTVSTNRKARHDFHLNKEIEAGIVLTGTEVKSLRHGQAQLRGAFVKIIDGEAFLFDCHISEYTHGNRNNHDAKRVRKLLLHRKELDKLELEMQQKRQTLVATRIYFKGNKAKITVSLAEGKKQHDKREDIKRRDVARDTQRELQKYR